MKVLSHPTMQLQPYRAFKRSMVFSSLAMLWFSPAFADTAATEQSSAKNARDTTLPEVKVAAQNAPAGTLKAENTGGSRLGISAIDTPATVQTITAESMDLRGDQDIVTATGHSVGIAALPTPGSGGYGFSARGFGGSSVTILYDGIKSLINTGSMTYPFDTWNIDRIETLNGPASVLYGGGAVGAAINVIPRKPSATSENTLRLSAGSFGTKGIALDSTGALNEKLLYRFDYNDVSSDGYVQRGDSSSTVMSGALTLLATDTLSFTLSADFANRHAMFYNGLPLINGEARESLRDINYGTNDTRLPFGDQRVTLSTDWQPSSDFKVRNMTYQITGQRLWKYATQFVYQPVTNNIRRRAFGTYTQHQSQLGNHTEAIWDNQLFGMKNTLSFGADIDSIFNKRLVNNYAGFDIVDLNNTSPGAFPNTAITKNWQRSHANQYALFAEDRLAVTDKLSLIGGLRQDHAAIERLDLVTYTTASKTFEPLSWRVGTVYAIEPDFNVYAQYSTATDPVSNLCCVSAAQLSYAMSEGKQTEIGVKQATWGGNLEWSLAAYQIIKDKLLTPDPANPGQSLQVGQQSSRGIEATLMVRPVKDWRIEANGTVLRAKYDDFGENVGGVRVSRNGNRPPNTPQRMANLWTTWDFAADWMAQAGVKYVGDMTVNTDNSRSIPAYTVANAGVRWQATKKVSLDLRVDNLFDKFYAYTSTSDGSNGGQWILGAPRSVNVAVTTKF